MTNSMSGYSVNLTKSVGSQQTGDNSSLKERDGLTLNDRSPRCNVLLDCGCEGRFTEKGRELVPVQEVNSQLKQNKKERDQRTANNLSRC